MRNARKRRLKRALRKQRTLRERAIEAAKREGLDRIISRKPRKRTTLKPNETAAVAKRVRKKKPALVWA